MKIHAKAIASGTVSRTNVIGLRKALNAEGRRFAGYSISGTAPKLSGEALDSVMSELYLAKPRVDQALFESGLKVLRNPRHKRRLAPYAAMIDSAESIHLVGFDDRAPDGCMTPVYEVRSRAGRFRYINVPWQSGGNGPEIVQ